MKNARDNLKGKNVHHFPSDCIHSFGINRSNFLYYSSYGYRSNLECHDVRRCSEIILAIGHKGNNAGQTFEFFGERTNDANVETLINGITAKNYGGPDAPLFLSFCRI